MELQQLSCPSVTRLQGQSAWPSKSIVDWVWLWCHLAPWVFWLSSWPLSLLRAGASLLMKQGQCPCYLTVSRCLAFTWRCAREAEAVDTASDKAPRIANCHKPRTPEGSRSVPSKTEGCLPRSLLRNRPLHLPQAPVSESRGAEDPQSLLPHAPNSEGKWVTLWRALSLLTCSEVSLTWVFIWSANWRC